MDAPQQPAAPATASTSASAATVRDVLLYAAALAAIVAYGLPALWAAVQSPTPAYTAVRVAWARLTGATHDEAQRWAPMYHDWHGEYARVDVHTGRVVYVPRLATVGLYVREGPLPPVDPVYTDDLLRRTAAGRTFDNIFEIMRVYSNVTRRACMAMHHWEGYEGPRAKNLIGIMLNDFQTFERAVNVSLIGELIQPDEGVSFSYTSTMCPQKVITARKSPGVWVRYMKLDVGRDIAALSGVSSPGGASYMRKYIEGAAAICVQIALDEMAGHSPCGAEYNAPPPQAPSGARVRAGTPRGISVRDADAGTKEADAAAAAMRDAYSEYRRTGTGAGGA